MENILNRIKKALKEKNYNEAISDINLAVTIEPTNELFFYKAYSLGEMNEFDESIKIYKSLLLKDENEKYLHGIVRILDKRQIDELELEYYKKLNTLNIKDERRDLNNIKIMNFYKHDLNNYYNYLEKILLFYLPDDNDDLFFKATKINNKFINDCLSYLFEQEILKYEEINNNFALEYKIRDSDEILRERENLYNNRSIEFIIRKDFVKCLMYKIGKLYSKFDKLLLNEIKIYFEVAKQITKNSLFNNDEISFDIKGEDITRKLERDLFHFFELNLYNLEDANHFLNTKKLSLLIFFYDFNILSNHIIDFNYHLDLTQLLPDQILFSPTIKLIEKNEAGIDYAFGFFKTRNIATFELNYYKLKYYFDMGLIHKFIDYFEECNHVLFETIYYYLYFLRNNNVNIDYYEKNLNKLLCLIKDKFNIETAYKYKNFQDFISTLKHLENKETKRTHLFKSIPDYDFIPAIIQEILLFFVIQKFKIDPIYIRDIVLNTSFQNFLSGIKNGDLDLLENSTEIEKNYIFLHHYGLLLYKKEEYQKSLKVLLESLQIQNEILNSFSDIDIYAEKINNLHYLFLFSDTVIYLSQVYNHLGKTKHAILILENNQRRDYNYLIEMSKYYIKEAYYSKIEFVLLQALSISESFYAYYHLSRISIKNKNFSLALNYLEKAKKFNPAAFLEKGKIYIQLKQYSKSLDEFNECLIFIKNHDKNVENFNILHETLHYEKLKALVFLFIQNGIENEEIDQAFNFSYKIFSKQITELNYLYQNFKNIFDRKRTPKINGKCDIIKQNHFTYYMGQGQMEAALHLIEEMSEKDKYLYLSLFYYKLNDEKKAKLFLEKSKLYDTDNFLFYFLCILLYGQPDLYMETIMTYYEYKFHGLFLYVLKLYLKNTTDVKIIDSLIELMKNQNDNHSLGILSFLNGEINKCITYFPNDIINKLYEDEKTYIDAFVLMKNHKYQDAFDLINDIVSLKQYKELLSECIKKTEIAE